MVKFEIVGKECVVKEVKSQGSSSIVYLPKSWVGRKIMVVLDGE